MNTSLNLRLPVIQSSKRIENVGGTGSGNEWSMSIALQNITRKIAQIDMVGGSPAPCALAALAARQDNIIARLEELRDQVGMWFCSGGITKGEEEYALCLHLI